jgi:outer membrane murein-binding lipoprotein Lpp
MTDQLPTDVEALQALVEAARAERDAAIARCDEKEKPAALVPGAAGFFK